MKLRQITILISAEFTEDQAIQSVAQAIQHAYSHPAVIDCQELTISVNDVEIIPVIDAKKPRSVELNVEQLLSSLISGVNNKKFAAKTQYGKVKTFLTKDKNFVKALISAGVLNPESVQVAHIHNLLSDYDLEYLPAILNELSNV